MPAYPQAIDRFITIEVFAFHTCSIGMPAICMDFESM
jgi:hypothetical protein